MDNLRYSIFNPKDFQDFFLIVFKAVLGDDLPKFKGDQGWLKVSNFDRISILKFRNFILKGKGYELSFSLDPLLFNDVPVCVENYPTMGDI